MMYFYRLVVFLGVVVLLCATAAAQTPVQAKQKINALPENSTMEETQAWLVRAIEQNSKYTVKVTQSVTEMGKPRSEQPGLSEIRITGLKFQGCQIGFTIEKVSNLAPAKIQTQNSRTGTPTYDNVKVSFDLKDINTDEITIKEMDAATAVSAMSAINMRTFDYKRVVKIKGDSEMGNITVSVASIVVGNNVIEQVRDALTHAITLCQAAK